MSCSVNSDPAELVSVIPSEIDIELVKDADTEFEFTLNDGDDEPVDITADTVQLTVRDYLGGATKLQKTNVAGGHSNPTDGKTIFTIANTDIIDTLTDAQTVWVYEVRRIDGSALEHVHIAGNFIIRVV